MFTEGKGRVLAYAAFEADDRCVGSGWKKRLSCAPERAGRCRRLVVLVIAVSAVEQAVGDRDGCAPQLLVNAIEEERAEKLVGREVGEDHTSGGERDRGEQSARP
jgi:hypothetical protein